MSCNILLKSWNIRVIAMEATIRDHKTVLIAGEKLGLVFRNKTKGGSKKRPARDADRALTYVGNAMKIPADLIAFVIAFLGSLSLTIPVRYLALRFGMVEQPGPRKVHVKPMPLLGGIAIYLGFVLAILFSLKQIPLQQVIGILAGATLLAAVGFLDDGGLLHHQVKLFIGMPVSALFLIASGIHAQFFSEFVAGKPGAILDDLATILW